MTTKEIVKLHPTIPRLLELLSITMAYSRPGTIYNIRDDGNIIASYEIIGADNWKKV